jgi:hypothetical protein
MNQHAASAFILSMEETGRKARSVDVNEGTWNLGLSVEWPLVLIASKADQPEIDFGFQV